MSALREMLIWLSSDVEWLVTVTAVLLGIDTWRLSRVVEMQRVDRLVALVRKCDTEGALRQSEAAEIEHILRMALSGLDGASHAANEALRVSRADLTERVRRHFELVARVRAIESVKAAVARRML